MEEVGGVGCWMVRHHVHITWFQLRNSSHRPDAIVLHNKYGKFIIFQVVGRRDEGLGCVYLYGNVIFLQKEMFWLAMPK